MPFLCVAKNITNNTTGFIFMHNFHKKIYTNPLKTEMSEF